MKNKIFTAIVLLNLILSGCKKSDDNSNSTTSILSNGEWKITFYYDTDHEETGNYSGYTFQFGNQGSLTGSNGIETASGSWSSGNDDSQEKLLLQFQNPAILQELNDDWHIKSKTSDKIELEDVSGGNGGTDYLTFVKK